MVKLVVDAPVDQGLTMMLSYLRFITSARIALRWPGGPTTEPTTWTMGSRTRMPMRIRWMM